MLRNKSFFLIYSNKICLNNIFIIKKKQIAEIKNMHVSKNVANHANHFHLIFLSYKIIQL